MVISRNGIVAAESPLAAQAGVRILEHGGNAVDAAIATNAMMGVVEPMMNGIGGDLFAIVYDAKANKLYGLNASGWAPKGSTIEYLQKQGIRSMPQQGVNAITVPGAVDGWQKLADKFGRKKLGEDLTAAIRTAQDGFPLPEWTAAYWAGEVDYLRMDETAAKTYLPPPNVQGLAALEMLNIIEKFPLGQKDWGFGSTRALHAMIEAKKLAYADLAKYIGDPRKQKLPVATLVSKEWAAQRAKQINPDRANCEVAAGEIPAGSDTTYLSVVDREGNMVSLIQSNYEAFGSGIVAPGTGFALQDRGGLFSLDPASPNALAGRKRPMHTIIPAFAQKGDTRVAFGIMGGWNQSQAHAQFVANLADFKMNIQAALEAPRFSKHSFNGCDVMMENRIPQKVREELAAKGHKIELKGMFSSAVGGGQAVMRDFAAGVNYGASDPRKDGQAVGELPLN